MTSILCYNVMLCFGNIYIYIFVAMVQAPLIDIVFFQFFLSGFSSKFLKRERFSHPCKECFVPLFNRCGISQSTRLRDPTSLLVLIFVPLSNRYEILQSAASFQVHPLRGVASSLIHLLVSGFDTFCDSSNPPLVDIVSLVFPLRASPQYFKNTSCTKRLPHPYKKMFVLLSNLTWDLTIHPPPLQGQRSL